MITYSRGSRGFLILRSTEYLNIDHIVSVTPNAKRPAETDIVMVNGDVHHTSARVKDVMDIVLDRGSHE